MPRPPPRPTLFPYTTLFRSTPRSGRSWPTSPGWRRASGSGAPRPGPAGGVHRVAPAGPGRSEEHTSELQSHHDLVCRLLLEKKKKKNTTRKHLLILKTKVKY